ncbi:transcriptional regulator, RpiR family [Tolumonas auensis DSM 9187]|uniref:Transcriptional regulator, RpiR family n=1 Tax=Tolumonas auensis (strain DSM 9187 / NBRC 110442 / TA 4) TaxID=595494 RepID=C4L7F8_TOLAT|nr:SIS domain-containing protein [Tolumonas auensis]ACQ93574.1 transcriptional regulator, RpiR family [Tolumonas auensis DSM 9187]
MIDTNLDALATGAKIRMALPGLSNTERQIAEWLLAKGNVESKTSIKSVAEQLEVSEPLIVKLSKKLGFAGFRELRQALVEYLSSLPIDSEQEIEPTDSVESVLNKVFANSIQAMKEARSVADPILIANAAQLIFNAKNVVIFGVGGSAAVCQDFEHKLLRIGILSRAYSDFHMMLMVSSQLDENDVIVVISQSGDTRELLKAVENAKQRHSRVICITNNDTSALAQLADYAIFSPAKGGILLGQNAVARIVQLNLLDVLFIAILLQDHDKNREKLTRGSRVVRHLHGKGSVD